MKALQRVELLKDFVQEAVDQGATSVQQIHEYIADLPFEALERAGLLDDDKLKLRARQQRSIGMVYDAIRRINKQVGQLISDQFGHLEETRDVAAVLREQAPAARPRRKVAAAKRRPRKRR